MPASGLCTAPPSSQSISSFDSPAGEPGHRQWFLFLRKAYPAEHHSFGCAGWYPPTDMGPGRGSSAVLSRVSLFFSFALFTRSSTRSRRCCLADTIYRSDGTRHEHPPVSYPLLLVFRLIPICLLIFHQLFRTALSCPFPNSLALSPVNPPLAIDVSTTLRRLTKQLQHLSFDFLFWEDHQRQAPRRDCVSIAS